MSEQARRAHDHIHGAGSWMLQTHEVQEKWREAIAAAIDTPPPAETPTGQQVRQLEELKTAQIGKVVGQLVGPGRGFILFTVDYGAGGTLAYVASVDRNDAFRTVREWLRQKGAL